MRAEYKSNRSRIEIYFDSDPPDDIIKKLKNLGWRWIKTNFCWRNKYNKENLSFAQNICEGNRKKDNRIIYEPKVEPYEYIIGIICTYTEYKEKDIVVLNSITDKDKCCNGISLKYAKNLLYITDGEYDIFSDGYYCPRCHKLYFDKKTLNKLITARNKYFIVLHFLGVSITDYINGEIINLSPVIPENNVTYTEKYQKDIGKCLVMNALINGIDISNVINILEQYGYTLDSFNDLPVNDQLNNDLLGLYNCQSIEDICTIPTKKISSLLHKIINTGKLDRVLISNLDNNQQRRIMFIYSITEKMYLEYSIPCSNIYTFNENKKFDILGQTITVKFLCNGLSSLFTYTLTNNKECLENLLSNEKYKKLCNNINNGILDDSDSFENQDARILDIADFLVRSTNYSCTHYNHPIVRINAAVKVKSSHEIYEIQVPAAYCSKCNRYYILERYYNLLKEYGYICCKIGTFDILQKKGGNKFSTFQDKSILSLYGYTVNQQSTLSEIERHNILDFIIDNGIQSKQQVINRLEQNISLRRNNHIMKYAIQKWEKDIEYVRKYQKVAKVVKVNSIIIPEKRITIK